MSLVLRYVVLLNQLKEIVLILRKLTIVLIFKHNKIMNGFDVFITIAIAVMIFGGAWGFAVYEDRKV